jgi:hypothetical protein
MHLTADGVRCTPLKNAHNLSRLLRFFIGVRLALSCDLLFLRWLLVTRMADFVIRKSDFQ